LAPRSFSPAAQSASRSIDPSFRCIEASCLNQPEQCRKGGNAEGRHCALGHMRLQRTSNSM
jgi:hypothetical protein